MENELADIDFGSSDVPPFNEWADLTSEIATASPQQSVPFTPHVSQQRPRPEPGKASLQFDFSTVIKALVIALPLATIFLLVFALNAGSFVALFLTAGVAFIVWLAGIGTAIYCNHLGEQGFSMIGKVLSTAGVLLIPLPLGFVLHITATSQNRGMVYKSLQDLGTDLQYSMESNASQLPEAAIPDLKYLEVTEKLTTTALGPLEVVELRNLGSVFKVVWSEDCSQAYLMTSGTGGSSRLWCYERGAGITCGVELLGDYVFGRSQQDLIIVRSDTQEMYFLDPKSLKVSSARSVRESFGLIAHPASPIVLVNTRDNLERIIDANSRRQINFFDASFFPDEHWLSHNGRPYEFANMTARMQFTEDGRSLMCVGGVFKIEGTKLTWFEPSPKEYWQVQKGDTEVLADGVLRLEYLDGDGRRINLSYRSPVGDATNSLDESLPYQDLVVPGDPAPVHYWLTSTSPDKSAIAVSSERKQYLVFVR